MENNKIMVAICWILSAVFLLAAVSISEGNISKMATGQLACAAGWFMIGIIYWRKGRKKEK